MAPIEVSAFLAERLSTGARAQILTLDVVAGIALCVVVMNRLLDGMPGIGLHVGILVIICYSLFFLDTLKKSH